MADNYEVKRYSRFWWGIIDPETKLYVKGEVGPYGLALFKTRQEAENKIAELEEPEPIDEVWTNGSGPGYYETIDYIRRDLENAGISFEEYDDGNFTIFAVKNLNAQEADEIIFNWINDYERKEGKSETSFKINNDLLFEGKEKALDDGLKEFDVTFYDGPNSDKSERLIIKAHSSDEAMDKAYDMPQAKRYDNVIVGERATGLTSYIVAFYANRVFNGKVENYVSEERLIFNAENESQAKAAYNKKYLGKYYKWLYPSRENVLSEPPTDIQGGKYGRVFDVYQSGSEPNKNADDAKEILNEFKK